jgi:hypothetical protein
MASVFHQTAEEGLSSGTSEFSRKPNFFLGLEARMLRGVEQSTSKIFFDLFLDDDDDDEDVSQKHTVLELQQKYPGYSWTEPTSEKHVQKIIKHRDFQTSLQTSLDRNEKGLTSTVVGLGAEFLTAGLLSPEFYVAPAVGRVATSASFKFLMHSKKLTPSTKFYGQVVNSAAKQSSNFLKAADLFKKKKFLTGAAEDAIITGLITEQLYQKREEILQNPRGALDYWGTIAASGAISGVGNSVLGRFVDANTFNSKLKHRSEELSGMFTGQNTGIIDPVFKTIAKAEAILAEALKEAKTPTGFNGKIRVFYDRDKGFTSAIDETTGDLIINTAKANNKRKTINALETPETVASLKNKKFHYKRKDGNLEQIKLPSTELTDSGISFLGNRKRNVTENPEVEVAPGAAYDPSKVAEVYTINRQRMIDDMGDFAGLAPEEQARRSLNSELPEGVDYPEDIFNSETLISELVEAYPSSSAVKSVERYRDFAKKELDEIEDLFEEFTKDVGKAFEFFSKKADDTLSKQQKSIRDFLQRNGITADSFTFGNRKDTKIKISEEYRRAVFLNAHRETLQRKVFDEWGGLAKQGRANVQGKLDGSLVKGGDYFEGVGNNVFNSMEHYRNQSAHLLKGVLARNGMEKYFDKYDDKARAFWTEVERALHPSTRADGISIEAKEVAKTLETIFEHHRILLNSNGAGIRKLDGYFLTTTHNRDNIVKNEAAWKSFHMNADNVDWKRMGYADSPEGLKERQKFVDSVYKDIQSGHLNDVEVDLELHGGKKGEAFSRARTIHYQPGKQVTYNDSFGKSNTAQTLLQQIELRAKAVGITEHLGPDFKKTWSEISKNLNGSEADLKILKQHFDEITGEANIAVNQNIADFSQNLTNTTNAIVLQGSGVTIAFSDPVSQFVALYSSGLASSMGRSLRMVMDSYLPAIQAIYKNRGDEATLALKNTIVPYDSNLQATRKLLGDTSIARTNNTPERLSLNVIKYSGAAIFTKISQMSSLIAAQRSLASILKSSKPLTVDFKNTLSRFGITEAQFKKLNKNLIRGDQLSVFHIENTALRRKFQNLLDEHMRMGSLQADPRQAASARLGTKRGTLLGETVRQVGLYMPTALAMHQKLLMRLAVMGNGDARFMELVKRGRRVEMTVVAGMMLGSATAVVSLKDVLKNREPFWAGDKPLDKQHMARILKVSGIVPLFTETKDLLTGGMAGQMYSDVVELADSAASESFWDTVAKAKDFSPFPWTNFGPAEPMFDTMVGFVAEEYLRDTMRRQLMFEQISGQGKLFD